MPEETLQSNVAVAAIPEPASDGVPVVRGEAIRKSFGDNLVLDGVDLTVEAGEVLIVMRDLARAGMTMIVVTHEMQFARDVGDKLIFIDEGRIVEQGRPKDVLERPQEERTRRFLRRTLQLAESLEELTVDEVTTDREGGTG